MPQVVTRSGRKIKKPESFKPAETRLEDDYGEDEHDSDFDSEIDTEDEYNSESCSDDDDDDDADENGNLKDFVVDSDSEEEDA
jgi:hypothetical protein